MRGPPSLYEHKIAAKAPQRGAGRYTRGSETGSHYGIFRSEVIAVATLASKVFPESRSSAAS